MSTSAAPSTSPTSAPPKPLSAFESKPEVKVIRQWASAIAKDINARAKALPRAAAFETAGGRARIPQIAQEDIGLRYPGPLPLTPVHVSASGSSATVNVCAMVQGWARDPKTGKPARKRSIHPIDIPLQKVDGAWRVDSFQTGQADCSSVKVTGVPW